MINSVGFLGNTSEGIPIRFWFQEKTVPQIFNDKRTQKRVVFINSAYPEFESINLDGSLKLWK